MRIALASDHAGFPLKEHLRGYLDVATGAADRAIVLGGSGQGEQIAANKVDGIRAALCNDVYLARLSREHNDANVLAMGARVVASAYAEEIVRVWLATPFEAERHEPRIAQIAAIERGEL
jgi:ribose 5-phosphate isomerase B